MYATTDDLTRTLGNFVDVYRVDSELGTPNSELDASLMSDDLAAACAEVDGYLAARYAVPVTASGALGLLKTWALALAAEQALQRSDLAEIPDKIAERAKLVRINLAKVAEGSFPLPAAPAESPTGQGAAACVAVAPPAFTRDQMQGY